MPIRSHPESVAALLVLLTVAPTYAFAQRAGHAISSQTERATPIGVQHTGRSQSSSAKGGGGKPPQIQTPSASPALSPSMLPPVPTIAAPSAPPPSTTTTGAVLPSTTPSTVLTPASSGGTLATDSHEGGMTLAGCIGIWKPDTHMTKTEWRTSCVRTLKEINLPQTQVAKTVPTPPPAVEPRSGHSKHRHAKSKPPLGNHHASLRHANVAVSKAQSP